MNELILAFVVYCDALFRPLPDALLLAVTAIVRDELFVSDSLDLRLLSDVMRKKHKTMASQ